MRTRSDPCQVDTIHGHFTNPGDHPTPTIQTLTIVQYHRVGSPRLTHLIAAVRAIGGRRCLPSMSAIVGLNKWAGTLFPNSSLSYDIHTPDKHHVINHLRTVCYKTIRHAQNESDNNFSATYAVFLLRAAAISSCRVGRNGFSPTVSATSSMALFAVLAIVSARAVMKVVSGRARRSGLPPPPPPLLLPESISRRMTSMA